MAIDKVQGPSKPDKMLQIQSAQKVIPGGIFNVPTNNKDPVSNTKTSTIHSGHFMVSRLHDQKDDDDDEEGPVFSDDSKDFSTGLGYDFVKATRETSQTYHFGPKSTSTLSIDASLTKLFECMTLAYSGKITSPKWKPFRGMHLTIKDKVRLNNIIWREWHMQYIFQMHPVVCQFATPLSDYIHSKPEAVVLEGKYWKRRLDTVTKEYKRWRRYYRDRILQTLPEASLFSPARENLTEWELLERVKEVNFMPHTMKQSSTDLAMLNADLMDMDFSDNLFSSLNQPFAFPNPRELSQLACADLIQPGLVQLQPNLEDFMDIDNLQELLAVSRPTTTSVLAPSSEPAPMVPDLSGSMDLSQSQQLFQNSATLGLLGPALFNSGNGNSNTAGIDMLTALAALSSGASNTNATTNTNNGGGVLGSAATVAVSTPAMLTPSSLFSSEAQMLVDDGSSGKQAFPASVVGQQGGGFLSTLLAGELDLKPGGVPSPGQTLTLQTNNAAPQHVFSSPAVIGAAQTLELQQLLDSHQQTLARQPTVLSQQPTVLSQPTAHPQQGTLRAMASVQQPVGGRKQTATASRQAPAQRQQRQQQQMGVPPTVQTVNLASLDLTQSQPPPSTLPYPLAVSLPTVAAATAAATVQPSMASTSPAKTAKGRAGTRVGQKASPLQVAGSGRVASGQGVPAGKKDVFAVPQGKPVTTPRKPRTIAPAPSPPRSAATPSSPTPSMQSTYLAQLLTKGTYPGALISVKTEPSTSTAVTTTTFSPVLSPLPLSTPPPRQTSAAPPPLTPAPTTLTFTATPSSVSSATVKLPSDITMEISKVSGVDFATSVLLAAASSAIGTTPSSLKDVLRLNPSNVATAPIASEMSTTPAASPTPRSPMQVALSPSPVPSATPPPTSPLAAVFSEALSPLPSPSSRNILFQQTSPPSSSLEDRVGVEGVKVGVHTEQRRVAHLSAEQKRRGNLKTGFDLLHTLVPALAQNPKVSKATMLQKTAEHCRKMKAERAQMQHEASILKQEIESLNSEISNVQAQLPETGVPVTRQRVDHMKDMFEDYVRGRTMQNWKFWIFSIIIRSLFDSYNSMVSTSSMEELCRTVAAWLDQHCSLVALRPTVLNALRHLSMTTSILTEPGRVREQATQAVTKGMDLKRGKVRDSAEGLP